MNVHVASVDATKIVSTPLVAISVPATLRMKSSMITKLALVRISTTVCMFDTDNIRNLSVTCLCIYFINVDIDECARNISGCNQNCTNTNGSYFCSCYFGYEIQNDNKTCVGKDLTHYLQV